MSRCRLGGWDLPGSLSSLPPCFLLRRLPQLFNVLTTEFNGSSRLGRPLIIAEILSMATVITFKFLFLFRRSQQPSHHEPTRPLDCGILPTPGRWSIGSRATSPSSGRSGRHVPELWWLVS